MVQFSSKKKNAHCNKGIGYADGLPRAFSGPVYYKNFKFPIMEIYLWIFVQLILAIIKI